MKNVYSIFILLFLSNSIYAQNTPSASYKVDFTRYQENIVSVTADIDLTNTTLLGMISHTNPSLPNGEATFVKQLEIKDATTQKPIKYKYKGNGDWQLHVKNQGQRISLSYQIALDHEKYKWDGGPEEVMYRTNEGIFMSGYALFLFLDMDITNVSVSFNLPQDWKISTPWQAVAGQVNAFTVKPSLRYLLNNCIFAGTHQEEVVDIQGFQIRMVLGQDLIQYKPMFVELLNPLAKAYLQLFDGCKISSYLIVVNKGGLDDGGAFRSSFSQMIHHQVTNEGKIVWGHVMAHEFFHLWNGLLIQPSSTEGEWLKEGFTDYYTNIISSRTKIHPQSDFIRRWENTVSKYIIAKKIQQIDVSVAAAGAEKDKNRLLVYGGGEMIAFALDVQIRQKTNNTKSMDDVMRKLYNEFGLTDKKYTIADVLRIVNTISGSSFDDFFNRYVTGKEYLDVFPYLENAGFDVYSFVEEVYLFPKSNPSQSEAQIREGIFGIK